MDTTETTATATPAPADVPRFNPEFKARWLAALRSGEYEQAEQQLRVPNENGTFGYCCIGVACDLLVKEGRGEWNEMNTFHLREGGVTIHAHATVESDEMRILFGRDAELPDSARAAMDEKFPTKHLAALEQLNDSARLSFTEIADIIEQHM